MRPSEPLAVLGVRDFRGCLFWQRGLQGDGDGGADEVEGAALFGGGLGEHGYFGVGAGEAHLVAGERAEMFEQIGEAAVGLACVVVLAGGLGLGGWGSVWLRRRGWRVRVVLGR